MAHGDHLKENAKPREGKKTFFRLILYLSCDKRLLFVIWLSDHCQYRG